MRENTETENDSNIMECIWCAIPSREECLENVSLLLKYCNESSKETIRQGVCKIIRWRRTRLYVN